MSTVTRCRHHTLGADPMTLGTCAKGHNIDTMVGPERFGIRLRMPCVNGPRSEPVPCPDVDHSGYAERVAAAVEKLTRIAERNECPECGSQLVGQDGVRRCPQHHDVFIIECRTECDHGR